MVALTLLAALAFQQQALPPTSAGRLTVDTAGLRHRDGRITPILRAVRASAGAPRVDGRLDDAVWAAAEPATGFRQRSPRDGDPASERTEVRIAYDDQAVYVGARMFDREPARIAAQMGRRDNIAASDVFEVDFDSYHDHLTSFQFYVNPLGVKRDLAASTDFSNGDDGWDPVWEVATHRDSLGWTAEFRIPLSQLRFSSAREQVWGVNFFRSIQRRGEEDWWSYVPQTEQGYASNFGHLVGLEDLPQPRRLELLPYTTGVAERTDPGAPGNPFNDGSRQLSRFGLDLQYGLTSDLTLNATVNPDFGQVEADPAEVNLTAYETYFSERRPFFVEGADIFRATSPGMIQVNGPQFLYSRRIGRTPQGSARDRGPASFADEPSNSTILGAAKLSGRTGRGWSVGLLEAMTAREFAQVDSSGVRFRDAVEPFTNYAMVRGKRDFGAGASTLGLTATAVNRRLDDRRLDFLRSAAYAGGVDFGHRIGGNRYAFFAALGGSYIRGDTLAIQLAQRSSARYYQRPDADYVHYDGARTSLAGWNAALGFSKERGSTNFAISASATSPGFEINDLGYQSRADRATLALWLGRRWTRPGRLFRYAQVSARSYLEGNFGGQLTTNNAQVSGYGEFVNFWSANAGFSQNLRTVNDGLTRGGPLGITPASWNAYVYLGSDYRKPVRASAGGSYFRNALDGWSSDVWGSLMLRPSSSVSLSVSPDYYVTLTSQQYVTARTDATADATFGRRYIFAEILQHSLDLTTRLDLTVSPTLSLQLYAQPFVATGDYRRYKELVAPRTTGYIVYGETPGSRLTPITGTDGAVAAYELDPDGAGPRTATTLGNPDFSMRSLRGNAVLRWEYRPGSTLFLVWTSSCSAYDSRPAFDAANDVRHLCQGRADNVFAVKLNYWISL